MLSEMTKKLRKRIELMWQQFFIASTLKTNQSFFPLKMPYLRLLVGFLPKVFRQILTKVLLKHPKCCKHQYERMSVKLGKVKTTRHRKSVGRDLQSFSGYKHSLCRLIQSLKLSHRKLEIMRPKLSV